MLLASRKRVPAEGIDMNEGKALTERVLTGTAIAEVLDEVATLRLEIFREYPYLYQGRRDDELAYLGSYAEVPDSCVMLACDGSIIIGALTGMPLIHDAQIRDVFAGTRVSIEGAYYVGELLFHPAYRNGGLGQRLLARLERHVRSLGGYRTLVCATVERSDDHPLRPRDYIPITRFLARTGFARLPGVTTRFIWRETDGVKRDHPMQFWGKELS